MKAVSTCRLAMSDELLDEVEAINSIYGDGSLTLTEDESSSIYILKLPGDASSLKIQFPASYPAQPPIVLGTHHSSGGVKGAGARDVRLFNDVLSSVFDPGSVCLFDAVEEFGRQYEELLPPPDPEPEPQPDSEPKKQPLSEWDFPPPEWVLSEVVVENKSTFVARVARITTPEEAKGFVAHLVATDRKVRAATHNITAWRVRGEGGTQFQDCDDDGEAAAGGRLLHLMGVMGVWGAVVVVSRWYGGVKLGPRRFAVINGVARDGMVRAGVAG
ncbi:RWD domain-containing protein [Pochonia chlamydosporia 170]|uniref:RWD domain-containing protein n=1 Tax=Pochonia chlamydosporia 170 TaxID=1380566 RepID=A0A179FHR9_METCM|nr:RWD domain-containing protein [Pochonia chlamydosporia 170]OAQ64818.1 RWD domain-containing protein [Pochonia chlamydosporia 170]